MQLNTSSSFKLTDPAEVVDGYFVLPQEPGAGITPTYEAAEKFSQPLQ